MEKLLTVQDLGDKLGFSRMKLRDLMVSGKLPYRKIGRHVRFTEEDVMALLRNSLVGNGKSKKR